MYASEKVEDKPPSTTKMFKNLRLELVRSASALFTKRLVRMEAMGVVGKRLVSTQPSRSSPSESIADVYEFQFSRMIDRAIKCPVLHNITFVSFFASQFHTLCG